MQLRTNKGWMSSQDSSVSLDILPNWIGQIALSGIETERVSQWTLVLQCGPGDSAGTNFTYVVYNCHKSEILLPGKIINNTQLP